jgi:hypothetical protein
MGLVPLRDEQLRVGKANADGLKENTPAAEGRPSLKGNAPLWYYILAEALHAWSTAASGRKGEELATIPTRLGPVGGRIVGEVVIGLLLGDPESFLSNDPNWQPAFGNAEAKTVFDRFTMGDLVEALPAPGTPAPRTQAQ